ncbi:MAG: DUF4159 domain-containing protein [Pseudomonadota bacterium]
MSFASPAILAGLLILPLIVWLLRAVPPAPVRRAFGGMFFLEKLNTPKQQPVRTPPIILIIRLLAFAALIIGLAGPRLGEPVEQQSGDVTIVLGNGWDAAQHWEESLDAARQAIAKSNGTVRLLTTTDGVLSAPYSPRAAEAALRNINVQAALSDWDKVAATLEGTEARTVLIPGGTAQTDGLSALRGPLSAYVSEANVVALGIPRVTGDAVTVTLHRTRSDAAGNYTVRALSKDGRTITSETAALGVGEAMTEVTYRLPLALRNEVARLSIDGVRSAGAVALLGSSARRTLAGIVSNGSETLREGGFYISRALAPSAAVLEGDVRSLMGEEPGLIILDDVGNLRGDERVMLETFVKQGGVLLRFSGPNMLSARNNPNDPLLTAPLLGGERALGGALTWAEPQRVASVAQDSPLGGIALREEIAVRRQVLTEPGAAVDVWASLADGTPLITAARRDRGLVVLVHVSAVPTWSDLPVSGLFAAIMQRLATLAETDLRLDTTEAGEPLAAQRLLDGRGRLIDPPADAQPLTPGEALPGPGLYGEGASEIAVNAFQEETLRGLTGSALPRGTRLITLEGTGERDLSGLFVAIALTLLALDALISMGSIPFFRAAATACFVAVFMTATDANAQLRPPLPSQAQDAALALRFAYVKTGDRGIDRMSQAGLAGLTREATRRSALEPSAPQGVDPDRDELSVYALIYWPIRAGQQPPSDAALQRLEAFMDGGGMLIIDTADGTSPGRSETLRDVLGRLDAPPLEPLPGDHVVLFSFYALDDLPGRNSGGEVWVETRGALDGRRDGVPSLIVSGRDWISAWALDGNGIPLRPAGPGGEVRREYAFRAGINMAMVAITGNYKADQADVQTMLDNLGADK